MKDFSYHLKKIRESRGYTVNQLAMKSEISSASISRYESGERRPKPENIKKLSDALKYPYNDLMQLAGNYEENQEEDSRTPVEKLIDYLDMELTNDEIKERMNFSIDSIPLTDEDVDEFIAFVRAKRSMKKQPLASASKSEDS